MRRRWRQQGWQTHEDWLSLHRRYPMVKRQGQATYRSPGQQPPAVLSRLPNARADAAQERREPG